MQEQDSLIAEQIKALPKELRDYIASEELSRKLGLVYRKYRLNEEQVRLVENEISLILLVLDSVDSLHIRLEEIGFSQDVAANLAIDISEYVLKKVEGYIVYNQSDFPVSDESERQALPAESPIKPIVGAEKLRPIVSPSHPHIENPPRKFITDPSHLIDDTVDERPKLQEHYND